MTFPREGGCQCGAVRFVVEASPTVVFACHCTACQRRSGAAAVVSLVVPARHFRLLSGALTQQTRLADSGAPLTHAFCAACGTPVLGMRRGTEAEGYETVRVGTLDDVAGLRPTVHCWTRSAQDWMTIPAGVHAFEGNPPVPIISLGGDPAAPAACPPATRRDSGA